MKTLNFKDFQMNIYFPGYVCLEKYHLREKN